MSSAIAALLILQTPMTKIQAVPVSWGLDSWYEKGTKSEGLIVAGSHKVSDEAIIEAANLVRIMLKPIPRVRRELIRQKIHVAVIARSEQTTDVPEYRLLPTTHPRTDWNARSRGLGPVAGYMLVSAAEENLLREKEDRYFGESIFIHEFSHAVMDFGLKRTDPSFMIRLQKAFDGAKERKTWEGTYAITNLQEYWAEGVQSFFAANRHVDEPDGIHNNINTPEELKEQDRPLFDLIRSVFGAPSFRWDRSSPTGKS